MGRKQRAYSSLEDKIVILFALIVAVVKIGTLGELTLCYQGRKSCLETLSRKCNRFNRLQWVVIRALAISSIHMAYQHLSRIVMGWPVCGTGARAHNNSAHETLCYRLCPRVRSRLPIGPEVSRADGTGLESLADVSDRKLSAPRTVNAGVR